MTSAPLHDGDAYRYQVSPRLLTLGGVCLAALLVLLLVGASGSWAWWIGVGVVGGLLLLTIAAWWVILRHGPLLVRLGDDALEMPSGALGGRRRRIPWANVEGLRIIGRTSAVRRGGREALYVLFEGRYAVLMSELFDDPPTYHRCRDAIVGQVQARHPDARIDVDGVPLTEDGEGL